MSTSMTVDNSSIFIFDSHTAVVRISLLCVRTFSTSAQLTKDTLYIRAVGTLDTVEFKLRKTFPCQLTRTNPLHPEADKMCKCPIIRQSTSNSYRGVKNRIADVGTADPNEALTPLVILFRMKPEPKSFP